MRVSVSPLPKAAGKRKDALHTVISSLSLRWAIVQKYLVLNNLEVWTQIHLTAPGGYMVGWLGFIKPLRVDLAFGTVFIFVWTWNQSHSRQWASWTMSSTDVNSENNHHSSRPRSQQLMPADEERLDYFWNFQNVQMPKYHLVQNEIILDKSVKGTLVGSHKT